MKETRMSVRILFMVSLSNHCWRRALNARSAEPSAASNVNLPLITLLIILEKTTSVSSGAGDSHPCVYRASEYATVAIGSIGVVASTFKLIGARPVNDEATDCSAELERMTATWYAPAPFFAPQDIMNE